MHLTKLSKIYYETDNLKVMTLPLPGETQIRNLKNSSYLKLNLIKVSVLQTDEFVLQVLRSSKCVVSYKEYTQNESVQQ